MLLERPRRRLRREELRERDRLALGERDRLRGERDRDRDRERDFFLDAGGTGDDLSVEWRPLTVLAGVGSLEPAFLPDVRERERWLERERGRRLVRRSLEAGLAAEEEPRLRILAAACDYSDSAAAIDACRIDPFHRRLHVHLRQDYAWPASVCDRRRGSSVTHPDAATSGDDRRPLDHHHVRRL